MKKIVKKLVAAALALTMVLSMAACSMGDEKKESSDSGKKSDGEVKVGFVVSDMSDAFFAHLIKNIEKYAKEEGVTFTAKECPEISDKITGIENFVQSGCDVIICHVTDADALKDAATSAEDAGVRFISYDSDIDGTSGFIGIDNHEYGYAIGKNAAEWINDNFEENEKVKVGVCNYPDYPFLVTREEGILDALKELAPNANVEVTAKAGYTPEGVDVGDAWVQSNKDLNVVVGINDAGVLGVYESFKSAGIKNDKLGMFGGDAVDDALAAIEEGGAFKATVSTNMLKNANYFIDMAVELAKNGKLEEREKLFPLEGITADNVAEYKKSIEEYVWMESRNRLQEERRLRKQHRSNHRYILAQGCGVNHIFVLFGRVYERK